MGNINAIIGLYTRESSYIDDVGRLSSRTSQVLYDNVVLPKDQDLLNKLTAKIKNNLYYINFYYENAKKG